MKSCSLPCPLPVNSSFLAALHLQGKPSTSGSIGITARLAPIRIISWDRGTARACLHSRRESGFVPWPAAAGTNIGGLSDSRYTSRRWGNWSGLGSGDIRPTTARAADHGIRHWGRASPPCHHLSVVCRSRRRTALSLQCRPCRCRIAAKERVGHSLQSNMSRYAPLLLNESGQLSPVRGAALPWLPVERPPGRPPPLPASIPGPPGGPPNIGERCTPPPPLPSIGIFD